MNNLGQEGYGWSPAFTDYKQLLEQLKCEDEMIIYESVMMLSNQLSVAQENTLTNFMLDQYIPTLLGILKRPAYTDISNEINMYCIHCLINLMDIFPTICGTVVAQGAIKVFCDVMERSMGFMDLTEACIKAFEKISNENPYAVLQSGVLALALNMMDFFENNTQKRILALTLNTSRHMANNQDFDQFIEPMIPVLCMYMNSRNQQSQDKIELISSIFVRIAEAFVRIYSPTSQFKQLSQQFTMLKDMGIMECIVEMLHEYSLLIEIQNQDGGQNQKKESKTISQVTMQNSLKLVSIGSRFSFVIAKLLLDMNIMKILQGFLPSQEEQMKQNYSQDKYPYIIDAIGLLDIILPDREEQLVSETEKQRKEVEKCKLEYFQKFDHQKLAYIAEKILPKVFNAYENNMQPLIRNKILQIIDKLILIFNSELLVNFIEPYSFAKFIYSNLRGQGTSQVATCLLMVEKLMESNPKQYTLPLIREGVKDIIQNVSNEADFEKFFGQKVQAQLLNEKEGEIEKKVKEFEALAKAKAKLQSIEKEGELSAEQQDILDQQMKKYIEQQKVAQQQLNQPIIKQNEINKKIIEHSQLLMNRFFNNEEFMNDIQSQCKEEFEIMNQMKILSERIVQEAQNKSYNEESLKQIFKQLIDCLNSNRSIMTFEFKESGLLEALELLLTNTPSQAAYNIEKKKKQSKQEEIKNSEQIQMSIMKKQSKKVTKKESRTYLQRLKLFMHFILMQSNNKMAIHQLIHLCHEILSQCENEIFDIKSKELSSHYSTYYSQSVFGQQNQTDLSASVNALKQLSKRIKVYLVYDPEKKQLEQVQKKIDKKVQESPVMAKMQSEKHPAFKQLGIEEEKSLQSSKVYQKRHYLYTELKQVLVSVEQCASLGLLEDFLRNKIKTIQDVKNLKIPQSFYDQMHSKSQAIQQSQQFKSVLEHSLSQMRAMIETGEISSEECAYEIIDRITQNKELTPEDQQNLIRQLEVQTLQMMDSLYQGGEDSDHGIDEDRRGSDSFEERLMSGHGAQSDEILETEQKLYDFHKTIETIKLKLMDKKYSKKTVQSDEKAQPKDEKLSEEKQDPNKSQEEKKNEELKQEEELKKQEKEEMFKQQFEQLKQLFKEQQEDVDMTDEEEERKKQVNQLKKEQDFYQQILKMKEQVSQLKESSPDKSQIPEDIEELLSKQGYEDVDYEFFLNGKKYNLNQTIYEIMKNSNQKKAQHTYHASQPDVYYVYFNIKDKQEEISKNRHDSILEFKRDRTKSDAYNDISMSSVNQIVLQLIEKEFSVFLTKKQEENVKNENAKLTQTQKDERKWLEQSLKILKVLNYLCKNLNLISSQGIKFILNKNIDDENEMTDVGFSDLDIQTNLSMLHPSIYHHHKLDSYILRNIQDPYNIIGGGISETLQQIFNNCSFLFPFQTRQLFFKLVSFIGAIDMNRSIYFLKQYLKSKGCNLQLNEKQNQSQINKALKQKWIIDRQNILQCTFDNIKSINKRQFLEIEFKDEIGTGQGPTLEFYNLFSENIKVYAPFKDLVIWRKNMPDNSLFPAPLNIIQESQENVQKMYEAFRVCGLMVAKSIADDRLIDLPFSSLFWDILLGKKMNIFDLERLDSNLFKIFSDLQILANKKRMIDKQKELDPDTKLRQIQSLKTSSGASIDDLSLYFVLPGQDEIELTQNGKDTQVTIMNLQDYIDKVMHYTFHETIKIQVSAFRKGFNSQFHIDTLKPFSSQNNELEEMICGQITNNDEWKNFNYLQENIIPAHGFHQKSQQYLFFIQLIMELPNEERRKFLKFLTGSPRLPNGGFQALDPKLTIVLKKPQQAQQIGNQINTNLQSPDSILPSVMTCQNYVKVPSYSTYQIMKERFMTAYNEGVNNFNLS